LLLVRPRLLQEAKAIGDEFLQLEKYVNLNYMGFHKILVRPLLYRLCGMRVLAAGTLLASVWRWLRND
jgi:hypothetical protein